MPTLETRGVTLSFQRRLEVGLVDAEAFDQHGTALAEQHVIGVGRRAGGSPAVVVGHGDDRLAALLKVSMAACHFLQLGEAGSCSPWGLSTSALMRSSSPALWMAHNRIGEHDIRSAARRFCPPVPQQLHGSDRFGALLHQHAGEVEGEGTLDGCLGVCSGRR